MSTSVDIHRDKNAYVIYEQPLMLAVKLQDNYCSCENVKTESLGFYQEADGRSFGGTKCPKFQKTSLNPVSKYEGL